MPASLTATDQKPDTMQLVEHPNTPRYALLPKHGWSHDHQRVQDPEVIGGNAEGILNDLKSIRGGRYVDPNIVNHQN
jgi:ribosomal protein L15